MNTEPIIQPLKLEGHLGKAKKRVTSVGVELEGGWITLPPGIQALEHDGSVFNGRMPPGARQIGELQVGPVVREAIPELMRSHYPPKINATCGMHIHMGFDRLFHYHLLMVPEYQETVLHYLLEWAKEVGFADAHHIWGRLKGESRFAQKKFWPDAQASTKRKGHDQNVPGHRYTAIHYCGRFSTIECRVLPMLPKVSQAISAINRVVEITDACIHALGGNNKRAKISGKITLPDNMVYEETIIETL